MKKRRPLIPSAMTPGEGERNEVRTDFLVSPGYTLTRNPPGLSELRVEPPDESEKDSPGVSEGTDEPRHGTIVPARDVRNEAVVKCEEIGR